MKYSNLSNQELDVLVREKIMKLPVTYRAGNISENTNPNGSRPSTYVGSLLSLEQCKIFCEEWNSGHELKLYTIPLGNPRIWSTLHRL